MMQTSFQSLITTGKEVTPFTMLLLTLQAVRSHYWCRILAPQVF